MPIMTYRSEQGKPNRNDARFKLTMTQKSFPLLRYFSVISLVCIIVAAVALSLFYRYQSIQVLISHGEQSNVVLTRAIYNTIWPHFRPFADLASTLERDILVAHPFTKRIAKLVEGQVENTPVLKVKIFDLNAKTVFSTDKSQIGEQKEPDYMGSIAANTGKVISKLSHRAHFAGINGLLHNRDIVSSYLPIIETTKNGERIVGVFEAYYDVSDQFKSIWQEQIYAFVIIVLILSLLYLSLFFFVKRADSVMTHQELDLKIARDQAMDASKAKTIFLANMSHELRTPLNAIIGYSEILSESELVTNEETRQDIDRINTSGRHLLSLINNILDLSKIEAGEMSVRIESFDIEKAVENVLASLKSLIDANNNSVDIIAISKQTQIKSDPLKFHQILYNLIGNANKFTEHGKLGIVIDDEMRADSKYLVLKITDTGIGMDQETADGLFDAFKQADDTTTRKYEGTGLGLAITRRLCELLGGDIQVESQLGRGSTFVVSLPFEYE